MSKQKSNKKFKLNPIAVAALVLCALVAVYCVTTAWITGSAPLNPIRFAQLQDFTYNIEVSKDSGASFSTQTEVLTYKSSELSDLNNLQVRIQQVGSGVAYIRVRISHEWLVTESDGSTTRLQGGQHLPFVLADGVYDNRDVDGYIYIPTILSDGETYSIIEGFDSASVDFSPLAERSDVQLNIDIQVGAVQFNRYRQIWGVDHLPWR